MLHYSNDSKLGCVPKFTTPMTPAPSPIIPNPSRRVFKVECPTVTPQFNAQQPTVYNHNGETPNVTNGFTNGYQSSTTVLTPTYRESTVNSLL